MGKTQLMLVACVLCLTGGSISAHHSFAAEFDINKPVSLTGTVTRVEWTNPHAWIYLDVKLNDGKLANWSVETGGPNSLYRLGWKKDAVTPGDTITVLGYQAKNGSNTANARAITLRDGRKLGAGSSAGNETPQQ